MTDTVSTDIFVVDRHLKDDEVILWLQGNGRIPKYPQVPLWALLPLAILWTGLSLLTIFRLPQPADIPHSIKLLIAVLTIAWAGYVLWLAKRTHDNDGSLVFVVTNERVLVIHPKNNNHIQQTSIKSLGNMDVYYSHNGDTLKFKPRNYFQTDTFFHLNSEWVGLSDANQVKSIIEKRKAEIAQETPQ